MINKYIKMRNSGQYQVNWFYDYYIENGGKSIGINQFGMVFNMVNLNEILESLDKKFNLMSVLDAKGNTLKVFKYE
jgi:hypothetical protein